MAENQFVAGRSGHVDSRASALLRAAAGRTRFRAVPDFDDRAWYGKRPVEPAQAIVEHIAASLHRALDPSIPPTVVARGHLFSREVLGRPFRAGDAKAVLEGFPMDVLLANRDAVGMDYDNLVVTEEGCPVRIDFGGALLYRALGKRKRPEELPLLMEWGGFADPDLNPEYADLFRLTGTSPDDHRTRLGPILAHAGRWHETIAPFADGLDEPDREAVVAMLEVRTERLAELAR